MLNRKLVSRILVVVGIAALFKIKLTAPPCKSCITTNELKDSYDYIVIGGGTAGSIIAAELATDAKYSVLLIEAGGPTNTRIASLQSIPGLAAANVASGFIDWGYVLEPQSTPLSGNVPPALAGRNIDIPRGKILGGSNELNYMLHVRASDGDYDGWAKLVGDDSWNSTNMRQYYALYENRDNEGGTGKVTVGIPKKIHPVSDAWVKSAGMSTAGNMTHCNDGRRSGGCHFEHAIKNGERHSTARAFLLPELEKRNKIQPTHSNLHVLLNAQVSRVVVEGAHATGVVLTGKNREGLSSGPITVSAAKEVILSAGAYESPKLLMLSGIGPAEHISAMGIPVRVNLPGVGAHLQDHQIIPLKLRFGSKEGQWWPRTVTKTTALLDIRNLWNYFMSGEGILATSCVDMGWFHYSNETYIQSDKPDLQLHGMFAAGDSALFNDAFRYLPDVFGPNTIGDPSDWSVFAEGMAIAVTLLHPKSTGSVRLTSRNPSDAPHIVFEGFHEDEDLIRLVEGIRRVQDLIAHEPLRSEYEPLLLPHHSLAGEFGFNSDTYWVEYSKRMGKLIYHPTGTCKMGKHEDPFAVVDSKLRVIGLSGLRVADASIMPEISSGNTNMPTATIALKLVDILTKDRL